MSHRHRRRRRKDFKKHLANRIGYSPFMRLLIFKAGFRAAVLGLVGLAVFLALFIPTIWTSSPKGFAPVVKVSGLSKVRVWQLHREAKQAIVEQRHEDADYFLRAAISKNAADAELYRTAIKNATQPDRISRDMLLRTMVYNDRLLRLSSTNMADLDLVCKFYTKRELYAALLEGVQPLIGPVSVFQEKAVLIALFERAEMEAFAARWDKAPGSVTSDPELKLYHLAYLAGWSADSGQGSHAFGELTAAAESRSLLARQLMMVAAAQRGDPDRYQDSLQALEETGDDSHIDHATFWKLLASSGRVNAAKRSALSHWSKVVERPPVTPAEVIALGNGLDGVGLTAEALTILDDHQDEFVYSAKYWMIYGGLLVREQQWDKVLSSAMRIRASAEASDELRGLSYFLEGQANIGRERINPARQSFKKAGEQHHYDDPELALMVASGATEAGFPEFLFDIIGSHGPALDDKEEYWDMIFQAAYALKQSELMLEASERLLEMHPNQTPAQSNYATALLIRRERPEAVVAMTAQLYANDPSAPRAALNHGLALLQNGRRDEANEMLRQAEALVLSPGDRASLELARIEIALQEGGHELARKASRQCYETALFPEQREWLGTLRQQIPELTAELRP